MIISPVRGNFKIAQGFGDNPKIYKQFGLKGHNGQDIEIKIGTPLYAPIDGFACVFNHTTGYGNHVLIEGLSYNDDGHYRSVLLAHFSKIEDINGKFIKAGDLLGYSGNSGYSFMNGKEYPNGGGYPHLHWQIRRKDGFGNVLNYDNGYKGSEDIFEKGYILENKISKY